MQDRDRISLIIVSLVELATNGFAYEPSAVRREALTQGNCGCCASVSVTLPQPSAPPW